MIHKKLFSIWFITTIAFNVCLGQDRFSGKTFASRSEVISTNGMVATCHPLATQIGIDVLKKGGNAIDAAIAANAFLGLADPGDNGVGGDLFAIVWDAKTKKLYGLNASGLSPKNLSLDYFKKKNLKRIPIRGPLAVSVPGCVDGWFTLHGRFGKLPMDQLLSPAIEYAKNGIPITGEIAGVMKSFQSIVDTVNNPTFKSLYLINGKFPEKGQVFRNPALANTLAIISKKGRDGFYKGEVATRVEKHIQSKGGFLNAADLENYHAEWVEPISTNYRGYDVWELPPNGQGTAVLQTLNILEGFDMSKYDFGSAEHMFYFIEAKRLAFEDMAMYYGDPRFNEIPIKKLIAKEYAAQRRSLIDPNHAGSFQAGLASSSNTIYLTTADKEGNMVSLIQSNFFVFGSMEVPDGLGFVLQNRGSSFEVQENHINSFAPGKRPFHTIIPGFITKDGEPFMSFGVMGGDMQAQGHVQVIMNIVDFGMNLQEAGDAPRMNHYGTFPIRGKIDPGDIGIESGFPYESVRELIKRGHRVRYEIGVFGGYQAIMKKNGVYYGASESRQDGQASGY
jgi:gamma-glutamyltranspeptidase / glutathione hydrolase